MKKLITTILIYLLCQPVTFAYPPGAWETINANTINSQGKQIIKPEKFAAYVLNIPYFKGQLSLLPDNADQAMIIELPMPDGSTRSFKAWRYHIMQPLLEAEYPQLITFTAYATDNRMVTAKLDYTERGFHAMIYDGTNSSVVDPYSDANDGYYISYYKHDYKRPESASSICGVKDSIQSIEKKNNGAAMRLVSGDELRTYRMALACTGEYAQAVGGLVPSKAGVLGVMITNLNRINGIYERELAVTFQLVNNEDTIIFLSPGGPYSNSNISALMGQNQSVLDSRILNANYDIGHVFSTGPGGVAQIGSICLNAMKAQGTSGGTLPTGDVFDVDYTAHEIGHQLGGIHTFNDNQRGGCAGNIDTEGSYEPGSGSTIMAYAGSCNGDDMQAHSDAYFHASSLQLITETLRSPAINTCPIITNPGNKSVSLAAFTSSYYIPFLTPFEFSAPYAVDSVADTLTSYCWDENDRGDFGQTFQNTHTGGPIFRSFSPSQSPVRVFPCLRALVHDTVSYLGEKVPDSARTLNFKLTVRDIYKGVGAYLIPDDSVQLHVVNTIFPFGVTNPNTVLNWVDTEASVSWDVSNTDKPPINCAYVDIYLSVDSGYHYPYLLAHVPNTGSTTVKVPNVATHAARIKVKGSGNVFFDISDVNFSINIYSSDISLYPNPVGTVDNNTLFVRIDNTDNYQFSIYNVVGQHIYSNKGNRVFNINTSGWAKGIYIIKLRNEQNGQQVKKSFVVR